MIDRRYSQIVLWLLVGAAVVVCTGCGEDSGDVAASMEFEIDKSYERGPLSVHVRVEKSSMTIAETVTVELEAAIEERYDVQMPRIDEALQSFGMVDWRNLGSRLDEQGRVVRTYRYRLEPFLSGTYPIPAFTFGFHDVNDAADRHELATEPIEIEVVSLLGEQRDELVIADIEGVVEVEEQASWLWVWVVGGAVVVVGGLAAVVLLRRKKVMELVRIFKPAHEVAYEKLRALVADDLVGAGRIKEFYERISGILRHYIEDRFDLRAPERTTEEFLAELRVAAVLAGRYGELLEEFLTHCDLVKFAKHDPSSEQIQRTFDVVKEFIEETKSAERKVDVTDDVDSSVRSEVA